MPVILIIEIYDLFDNTWNPDIASCDANEEPTAPKRKKQNIYALFNDINDFSISDLDFNE